MLAVVLASCAPGVPTQEIKVSEEIPVTRTATIQEPVVTETPTAIETPTLIPSMTPPGCLTLLTPLDGAQIPATGKVTFAWEPMDGAAFYVLEIIQPSGAAASFETKQTFRDQYMEAFWTGGSYQWRVIAIAQERKRTELCRSELAMFSKSASNPPPQTNDDDRKKR